MLASTQNTASHASEQRKCISTCVDKPQPIPPRTQNASPEVLTKLNQCKRGHKKFLNLCISKCIEQKHPKLGRTQNASQHVLNKPLPCHGWHKMHLNQCLQKPSHASEETNYISQCDDQTPHMPTRTLIYLNMC